MSNVNLNLYRIFCKVAQSKSYSEAAEKLGLSVPNVSKQISSLEEQLNLKLFNRESKGVTLTTDGQELYEIVNKSLSSFDFAEKMAKDKERKDALSMLLGALKAKAIDKREDLTEAEENSIIAKEIKQCKDTIEMSPADRTDIIDQCKLRIAVYEEFAPKQMSEDEIKATIQSVLDELGITEPTGKDRGKIMKDLMPKVKGKADGKLVNQMVASMLK